MKVTLSQYVNLVQFTPSSETRKAIAAASYLDVDYIEYLTLASGADEARKIIAQHFAVSVDLVPGDEIHSPGHRSVVVGQFINPDFA